jgi:hypothetical protein
LSADPARGRLADWRLAALLALGVVVAGVAWRLPPIAQDAAYHDFADRRTLLGIPNALNVLSNVAFVAVGALGILRVLRDRRGVSWERAAFGVFFAGVLLTGLGSGYYHLAPTTAALFWDRLPMTLAFTAFLALVLGERVSPAAGPWLLPSLLAAGGWSVVAWRQSELGGAGDLRLYGLVQFLPMAAIPLAVLLYPRRWLDTGEVVAVAAWYALSKVLEALDRPIFAAGGLASGHTLKHLAAAVAALWLLRALPRRRARPV